MVNALAQIFQFGDRIRWVLLALFCLLGVGLSLGVGLPIGAAIILVGVALATLNPAAALAAALAATPFIFHPVDFDGRAFTLLEIMLVVSILGTGARVALEAVVARNIHPVRVVIPSRSVTVGSVLLVGIALFSLTNLADPEHRDASVRVFRTVIIEPLLIIPTLRWALRRRQIDLSLGALAVALTVCTIWGVGEVITGSGVAADGVRRATGPYDHPNNLSFFLERATLLVAIPALLSERFRRFGLIVLMIGVIGVLATLSRGALISLPAGIAVALWLTGRLKAVTGVAAALLAAIGAFALFAGDRLFDVGGEGSEPSRVVIWDASVRMLRDFPLSGIGLDQFFVMYGLRYIEPTGWPERYTSHPHNIFLDAWLSLGIGGLILVLLAIIWLAARMLRLRSKQLSRTLGLAVGGAAALTAGLVHGLVDNAFFLPDLAVLTWFSIALLVESPAIGTRENEGAI